MDEAAERLREAVNALYSDVDDYEKMEDIVPESEDDIWKVSPKTMHNNSQNINYFVATKSNFKKRSKHLEINKTLPIVKEMKDEIVQTISRQFYQMLI